LTSHVSYVTTVSLSVALVSFTLLFPASFSFFFFFLMIRPPPRSTLFPTRRSSDLVRSLRLYALPPSCFQHGPVPHVPPGGTSMRSEEHTSELQSLTNLVCRLLLEKKKTPPDRRPCA